MKSVILCEGSDDLWFIAYYLHKTAGWDENPDELNQRWKLFRIPLLNKKQNALYIHKRDDTAAIWCVGGKDGFKEPMEILFNRLSVEYPTDPIETVVIVRDRDADSIEVGLQEVTKLLPGNHPVLKNGEANVLQCDMADPTKTIHIVPVLIPFDAEGAIETILTDAIADRGEPEAFIVAKAREYITTLVSAKSVMGKYLTHDRLITKAKYSAVVAATNPDHSTGLFQDMVMACPWEKSPSVKKHFGIIGAVIESK